MSNQIKDGGPAFPLAVSNTRWEDGMSLRDFFAKGAMEAMINSTQWKPNNVNAGNTFEKRYAQAAYKFADAMLAARNEGGKP